LIRIFDVNIYGDFKAGSRNAAFFLPTALEAFFQELSIEPLPNLEICRGQSRFRLKGCPINQFFSQSVKWFSYFHQHSGA